MTEGQVTYYNEQRGFGFISNPSAQNAPRLWFHVSNVRDENDEAVDTVRIGDRVSYSTEPSRKKPGEFHAFNIKLVERQND